MDVQCVEENNIAEAMLFWNPFLAKPNTLGIFDISASVFIYEKGWRIIVLGLIQTVYSLQDNVLAFKHQL